MPRLFALLLFVLVSACGADKDDKSNTTNGKQSAKVVITASDTAKSWESSETKVTKFPDFVALIANGPNEASIQITLNGITQAGEFPVAKGTVPGIHIVIRMGQDAWISDSATSAKVELNPYRVSLTGVKMVFWDDNSLAPFQFDAEGEWTE